MFFLLIFQKKNSQKIPKFLRRHHLFSDKEQVEIEWFIEILWASWEETFKDAWSLLLNNCIKLSKALSDLSIELSANRKKKKLNWIKIFYTYSSAKMWAHKSNIIFALKLIFFLLLKRIFHYLFFWNVECKNFFTSVKFIINFYVFNTWRWNLSNTQLIFHLF